MFHRYSKPLSCVHKIEKTGFELWTSEMDSARVSGNPKLRMLLSLLLLSLFSSNTFSIEHTNDGTATDCVIGRKICSKIIGNLLNLF